ncbi:hypothetical protein GQ472_01560 [archaeon]|nr:hypothetical protein [archaeon]
MDKQQYREDLNTLYTDCGILKNCDVNDDVKAKLEHMQLILTKLILQFDK